MSTVAAIQNELALFTEEHSDPIARVLIKSGEWLTASDILHRLNLTDTEANRRSIRACAENLGDELISGQLGYKHVDVATSDEVRHFCNWMDSQGDKMKLRAARTRARKGL
jgi:hypothetical protein